MTGIERTLQLKHFLIYNFVFWLTLCIWDFIKLLSLPVYSELSLAEAGIIRWPVAAYLSYWILSYMIFDFYQQTRNFRRPLFLVFHTAASVLFGILHKFLSGIAGLLLERLLLEMETKTLKEIVEFWNTTYVDVLAGTFIYWLVLIILLGLDYYRKFNDQQTKRLELEGELTKAQLKNMKLQMNPHFLFNAFNTIAMMVRQKKSDAAVEMIGGLSDMFRMSLNKESRQFVKLQDEIELLKKYLAIESVRYQDRLSVIWDIDENTLKYQVPNFVLQPIVENAFKHGISKSLDQATLGIYTRKEASHLILEVFNSGAAFSSTWELQKDKGIGLSNTIDRLLNLYKEDFKFLINEKDNGVSVVLKIPVIS